MLTSQIQKVNEIYHIMKRNYDTLTKMFHNHKIIKGKIDLSEKFLMQAFMSITNETTEIETNREFNKIIKDIKEIK
jgi:hypothetical protein